MLDFMAQSCLIGNGGELAGWHDGLYAQSNSPYQYTARFVTGVKNNRLQIVSYLEYNESFQQGKWLSVSYGGFVRRRNWTRLCTM